MTTPDEMRAQGFEPWTYGLKERGRDARTRDAETCCDNVNSVVATLVATGTPDNACESTLLDDDLGQLIEALPADLALVMSCWEKLSEDARKSLVALVQTLAGMDS